MTTNKQGQSALFQAQSGGVTPPQPSSNNQLNIISGRVDSIIMDQGSEGFESWNDLGRIGFTPIDVELGSTSLGVAYPLDPYNKKYPLKGETVLIFKLTHPPLGAIRKDIVSYFYTTNLNLFNTPEHNADPRLNSNSTEFDFSGSFDEKGTIPSLLPFIGDNIINSRFGSSLRLGNTYEGNNNWSKTGNQGDPITILSNGHPTGSAFGPITEQIDEDKTSIYLTSTQQIPLTSANTNYSAVRQTPEVPNAYSSNQVILNSGRLVFNSNIDSILLSSQKTVTISANEDIGLTSEQNVALVGTEVKLGSREANQSVILGDIFLDQLETLLSKISSLASALEALNNFPGGIPLPNLLVNSSAYQVKDEIVTFRSRISKFKSTITKTS